MVRLHGFHNAFIGTEFLKDLASNLNVRALDFVVERFADVVQEPGDKHFLGIFHGRLGAQNVGGHRDSQ